MYSTNLHRVRVNGVDRVHVRPGLTSETRRMTGPNTERPAPCLRGIWFAALFLGGCAAPDINTGIDSLNKAVKGVGVDVGATRKEARSTPAADATTNSDADNVAQSVVNFKRRMPGNPDILRSPIEDGAMQLRIGQDFYPTLTVDNAMPFFWSASCDIFYLLSARLPKWAPPPDGQSRFSMVDACTLNEGGQRLRRSAFDDPIRRRRPYQFTNAFDLADALKEWHPIYAKRRAEIEAFKGNRFFFIGTRGLTVEPYDARDQSFRVIVDLKTGYAWDKAIVFVGPQLAQQIYAVRLKTDEPLARAIERGRTSSGIHSAPTRVVFRLNAVREYADRIDLDITLEKIQMQVAPPDQRAPLPVDLVS